MKKRLAMVIVVVFFAALLAILPSTQVKAASDKPVLEVTVTDAKSGVAMISGIDIPETLEWKYDGVEGGHCAYIFDIYFGEYGVCLDITANELMDYAEMTGNMSFPITEMKAKCVSYDAKEETSIELLDCSAKLSFTDNKLCFDFSFSDNHDVDLTKVDNYTLQTLLLKDYQENNYKADKGNVVKAESKKEEAKKEEQKKTDEKKTVKAPAKVKLSSVKASKGKVKLTWKKVSGASGYQIFYSEGKKGTYKELATVKGKTKKSYTTDSLTAGTYYFKVRAYKESDGKKYYGKYSTVKSAKVVSSSDSKTAASNSITITGDVISFPVTAEKLISLGWEWSEEGGKKYSKGNIYFVPYNGQEYATKGQTVTGFKADCTWFIDSNVKLDSGISFDSTLSDVKAAYGKEDVLYEGERENTYEFNKNGVFIQLEIAKEDWKTAYLPKDSTSYQIHNVSKDGIISMLVRYEADK